MYLVVKQIHTAFITLLFLFVTIGMGLAAHPDNGPGCGLGKLAWGDYPNQQDVGPQVLMSTTNVTFGSQSFGVSSGTSGCTNNGAFFQNEKVARFSQFNLDNLAQEMAQGQGEHLTSLATLMGIPAQHHQVFFQLTQQKYSTFLQTGETSPSAVFHAVYKTMNDSELIVHLPASKKVSINSLPPPTP